MTALRERWAALRPVATGPVWCINQTLAEELLVRPLFDNNSEEGYQLPTKTRTQPEVSVRRPGARHMPEAMVITCRRMQEQGLQWIHIYQVHQMEDVPLCNQNENMLLGLSQLIARRRSKAQMLMSYYVNVQCNTKHI